MINNHQLDMIKNKIKRKATVMQIGGFRPDSNLDSSWFGKVLLRLPSETWPTTNGEPMVALCQINLTKLPYVPNKLKDIELITVFIGPKELPINDVNGVNWCLRAYNKLEELVPIEQVDTKSHIKALPMNVN